MTQGQQKSTGNFQQVADVQVYFWSINIFVLTLSDVFYNKKNLSEDLAPVFTGWGNCLLALQRALCVAVPGTRGTVQVPFYLMEKYVNIPMNLNL